MVLGAGEKLPFHPGEQPRLLSIVSGEVLVTNELGVRGAPQKLARGDNALLPYAGEFLVEAERTAILLVTEDFA